jgi:cholesterol oxidase
VHYYRHINKMVKAGNAVRYNPKDPAYAALPADYLADPASITTPYLFITGANNHVFTDSNIACHESLSKANPGLHELAVIPGYGHVDPFIGKNAHEDVFPHILSHLRKHSLERVA